MFTGRGLEVPNGHDKNWSRTCAAIDGFRMRYGRWPKRVRMSPVFFADVVGHLLSPAGYTLVSEYVRLVPDDEAEFVADDGGESEFRYGEDAPSGRLLDPPSFQWFGQAIMRDGPEELVE